MGGLDATLKDIENSFGAGSIMRLANAPIEDVDVVSTGSLALDKALGVGGMPRGRIVEVYGPESSGKTTIVQHVIASAQKDGGVCAFIDAEHALDLSYARATGVDTDALLFSQPSCGEEALEIAARLVASGEVAVVAIDSVAALTPRAEINGEMGELTVGGQARLMGQAMRKLAGPVRHTNTLLLFTNQIREKIGVMFGSPETTPGGRALKFYCSQRLDIRRIETLKEANAPVANRVRVKVVKNKVASPLTVAEFTIRYGTGIDVAAETLELGLTHKLITKSGSWFNVGSERAHGEAQARELLRLNDPLTAEIRKHALPLLCATP
jgi:recombination protein RecA